VKSTAILEEKLPVDSFSVDSSFSKVTHYSPNKIVFDIYANKQGLFAISELYYPPGWKIFIDNRQVEKIYKTDHAIQSIIVPEGKHVVELKFAPDSYKNSVRLAGISLVIVYLSIIVSLIFNNKNRIIAITQKIMKRGK
jgi:uncharacterized membrane protein YfhO